MLFENRLLKKNFDETSEWVKHIEFEQNLFQISKPSLVVKWEVLKSKANS